MSLLAHIVSQNLSPGPVATQSLAYILRKAPELAESLTGLLRPSVGFKLGHVASEVSFGDARPDLTIFDSDSRHRILVNTKFSAGLTDAQPVQYLVALPDDLPSGLMFILPERRIPSVWDELKRRSRDAYEFGNESSSESVTLLQMGTRTLCVTSWREVLKSLKQVNLSDALRSDVLELDGLVKFGELDGFPPLRGQELSAVSIPKRMIDFRQLVKDIVAKLEYRGIARTKGPSPIADWNDTGRYFEVLKKYKVWLGVTLVPWRKTGITPLWLRVYPGDNPNLGEHYRRLGEFFEVAEAGNDATYLPIRLRTGVEREEVIRDAADQVQRIAERFREITEPTGLRAETA